MNIFARETIKELGNELVLRDVKEKYKKKKNIANYSTIFEELLTI